MPRLLLLSLVLSLPVGASAQLISEIQPNPPGADPSAQSLEISGTPSGLVFGFLFAIESDSDGLRGRVLYKASTNGAFNSSGLLHLSVLDIDNPSVTLVLTSTDATAVVGDDIDLNDDGVADNTAGLGTIFDAIGSPDSVGDETYLYGADLGGTDFDFTGDEPEIIFRSSSTGAWYAVNTIGDDTSITDVAGASVPATSFDADPSAGTTFNAVNPEFTGGGGAQTVTLAASPADGGTIEEATTGSTAVVVTLTTSDGAVTGGAVSADVVLASGINAGDFTTTRESSLMPGPVATTFDENTPVSVAVPAGVPSGTTVTIEVTAVDDSDAEGPEAFQAEIQNVTGATVSGAGTFDFTVADDDQVAATNIAINELRVDQDGADTDEYVEISGTPGTLDGLTYVVIGDSGSGGGGVVEEVISLDGQSMPADGYFLMAESTFTLAGGVDFTTPLSFENTDNVTHVIVSGWSGDGGQDLDTNNDGTLDLTPWRTVFSAVGVVHDPAPEAFSADPFYGTHLGFDDVGPNGGAAPFHIYRNETTGTYQIGTAAEDDPLAEDTPGTANPAAISQSALADQAGYRLLALPIVTGTASDLAETNLIQGATGQYPTADPNIQVGFDGTDFVPLGSAGDALASGQGFFKYLFDVALAPPFSAAGGGTSVSQELAGYTLSLAGTPPSADVTLVTGAANGGATVEGAYMIGNPFGVPLDLFGITQTGGDGALSTTFAAWDPTALGGTGDYDMLDGSTDDGTFIDVFQGVFAAVVYGADPVTPPTFAFAIAETDATATPPFVGRRAAPLAVGLDLLGESTAGATLGDGTADLWFRETGALGQDRVDAPELPRPGGESASLALVDDGAYRAVRGLPLDIDGTVETPVAFRTTAAGTFAVGFDPELALPDGLTATLVDRVTGLTYTPGQTVPFASDATDWTERFTLVVSGASVATEGDAELALRIGEVFPNPSSGRARISLEVDAPQRVAVTVIDAIGRVVATAFDADVAAGSPVELRLPVGLAPGAYSVRVQGSTFVETRRLVVVR